MTQVGQAIIVGVDYSDSCIPAIDQALELSGVAPGRQLVAVLALPGGPPTRPSEAAEFARELVERSKQTLLGLLASRARKRGLRDFTGEAVVRFGTAAECLLDEAKTRGAGLIVVGTHGRQNLEQLFVGSVARELVQRAPCSVLVARGPAEAAQPEQVAEAEPQAGNLAPEGEAQLLSEPHIDAGRVVLTVLDSLSGQVFVCSFDDLETVRVDPLEGNWVPQPSSQARARAAQAAIAMARRSPSLFGPLFAELARRKHSADQRKQ